MRKIILVAAIAAIGFPAAAQQKPAAKDANTPAVNTPNTPPIPAAPVAGANSFTEGQAKSRSRRTASPTSLGCRRTPMALARQGEQRRQGRGCQRGLPGQRNAEVSPEVKQRVKK